MTLHRSSMRSTLLTVFAVLILCTCSPLGAVEVAAPVIDPTSSGQPDELCQELLTKYVLTQGKINQNEVDAACDLLAYRGRTRGFWLPVLEELKKGNAGSEMACIRILGLMLEGDASARSILASGEETAVLQFVCLPDEVVPELILRAEKRDPVLDLYIIALARSRDERCKDFFTRILNDSPRTYSDSNKFHAAAGLANLNDPAGVEWMIANCERSTADVWHASPARIRSLDTNCVLALRSVSNNSGLTTRSDFETWWKEVPKPFKINWPIAIR